uniref:Conserved oligomeric Golgi complex subunit 3 n=1 Tax=Parascaris equorum TaxID=6256 RepID=A0A914RXA7_PAREQ
MHAQLFVVKHLLILRGLWDEHALQRDYSLDLSKYKTSATQLFHDRGHWFELNSKNAFIEFLFQLAKGDVDVKKEALIRSAFDLYIGAKDTEDILLQPVRKRIVDFYDEEQKQIAGVPVLEQIWLVLNSA